MLRRDDVNSVLAVTVCCCCSCFGCNETCRRPTFHILLCTTY